MDNFLHRDKGLNPLAPEIFMRYFPMISHNFEEILGKFFNSKAHQDVPIYQNYMFYFAFDRDFRLL